MAKIIVADNDGGTGLIIREELSDDGHEVLLINNAFGLTELIKRSSPELIVIEVMAPGCNGLDILQVIHREFCNMPIIVFTYNDDLKEDARITEARSLIIKSPRAIFELKQTIRLVLLLDK